MWDMVIKIANSEDPLEFVDSHTRPWNGSPDTRIRIDQLDAPEYPDLPEGYDDPMIFGIDKRQHRVLVGLIEDAIPTADDNTPAASDLFGLYRLMMGRHHENDPKHEKNGKASTRSEASR